MKYDAILVLDFGGQYCNLIARRIREHSVYSEIVPCDITTEEIEEMNKTMNVKGMILSGGPWSVYQEGAPKFDPKILDMGIPILGLCYGHQMIAYFSDGKVEPGSKKEYGIAYVTINKPVGILKGLGPKEKVWMSHGDRVARLPAGFASHARSENSPYAAIGDPARRWYGLQFHPEVTHTRQGKRILERFLFEICGCQALWNPSSIIDDSIQQVRELAGDHGRVVLGLSGKTIVSALMPSRRKTSARFFSVVVPCWTQIVAPSNSSNSVMPVSFITIIPCPS